MSNVGPLLPATGNTEHTKPQAASQNRAFYPALDGLRAIAFLMVFFQHYYDLVWGWGGVNIFFVLSGFLITGILFDTRGDAHRARNFYVRRMLRIFPLYYGVLLALLLVNPIVHWNWTRAWLAWPFYLGNLLHYLSPAANVDGSALKLAADAQLNSVRLPRTILFFGHFWSLCVEEQFYLFWPWIVFWLRSRRALLWTCGAAVLLAPFLRIVAQNSAPTWMLEGDLVYRTLPFQLDSLLLGGLVAMLWRGAHRERLLRIARVVACLTAITAAVYLAITLHTAWPHWRKDYVYPTWRLTWGLSFINLFAASVILCCLQAKGWVASLLSNKPLRLLGRISYGAYIFHDIFHGLYAHIILQLGQRHPAINHYYPELTTLFGLAGTVLLAWLSFRFFETPFLNLKQRFTLRSA